MKKRFLGIICLLYSCIIAYVLIFDKLKNFLSPTMQIYIKLSLAPMIIISLVMLLNNKINYKFKISDLVLILPIILLIFAGDGRLTSSFAKNRTINFNNINRVKIEENKNEILNENTEIKEEQKEENTIINEQVNNDEIIENSNEDYDFSKVDFDIIDANYSELSNYITFYPAAYKYEGKTIRVSGFSLKNAPYLQSGYFALGKYVISCCAADAEFGGFIVKYDVDKIKDGKWYEIQGLLERGKDSDGYDIMYIKVINIKEIKEQDQYVYPCYSYDDGSCAAVTKYNLEY